MNFDQVAASWDTKLRKERAAVLAEKIVASLENNQGMKAMEIGCGTGLISINLKDKFAEIYCVDESEEMLRVLQDKLNYEKIDHIYPRTIKLLEKERFYRYFDVIYSSMAFHHIEDVEKEFAILKKLLIKEGQLIIIDLDQEDGTFHKNEVGFRGHNGFNRNEFVTMCENAGFTIMKIETVYEGKKNIDDTSIVYSLFLCAAKNSEG